MYLSEKGDEDTLMIVAQINSSSTRYDVTHYKPKFGIKWTIDYMY